MVSRLDAIHDWEARARAARFCIATLARSIPIGERQLRRFIRSHWRIDCHHWIDGLRRNFAIELLGKGVLIKEVAYELGFKSTRSFDKAFRGWFGDPPSKLRSGREFTSLNAVFEAFSPNAPFETPPRSSPAPSAEMSV